jgi:hypothetical protein
MPSKNAGKWKSLAENQQIVRKCLQNEGKCPNLDKKSTKSHGIDRKYLQNDDLKTLDLKFEGLAKGNFQKFLR